MTITFRLRAILIGFVVGVGLVSVVAAQDDVPRARVTTGAMRGPRQAGEVSLYWGHLGIGDQRLPADNTFFEDREILLTPGMTYRIEVRAREYRPNIWIQRRGAVDPDHAKVEDAGQWKMRRWPSPLAGRVRTVGEAVLDFTYPQALPEDEYLLVINTMRPSDDGFYRVTIKCL